MAETQSQHPAQVRARRIAALTEYIKDTDFKADERAEKLVAYSIRTWGVSKQTAKDYMLTVILQVEEVN